ncbi:hypothetical protein ACROYT_G040735 [Oculina patagonica]
MEKQIQKLLLANKKVTQTAVNVVEVPDEKMPESSVSSVPNKGHGSLVAELREFLEHKTDFGSSVKACIAKVFSEQEMKTCSVRGKRSKDGKQRDCLPQHKLSAIIDAVKEKFGQGADVVYKMNQILRNMPGREKN